MKRLRRVLSTTLSLASAAMLGLAAGALWMLPVAYLQVRLAWLAVPIGALLGWAIARWVSPRRGSAAWQAALATLLAALYVSVLLASVRLAGAMDLGLTEAMRTAGPAMLWSLVAEAARVGQWAWFLGGAAAAALTAGRLSRRAS